MTPGKRRAFAYFLRETAAQKRHMAASSDATAYWRRHWLDDADRMEEDAEWYEQSAGRGEIEVEYLDITQFQDAAQ